MARVRAHMVASSAAGVAIALLSSGAAGEPASDAGDAAGLPFSHPAYRTWRLPTPPAFGTWNAVLLPWSHPPLSLHRFTQLFVLHGGNDYITGLLSPTYSRLTLRLPKVLGGEPVAGLSSSGAISTFDLAFDRAVGDFHLGGRLHLSPRADAPGMVPAVTTTTYVHYAGSPLDVGVDHVRQWLFTQTGAAPNPEYLHVASGLDATGGGRVRTSYLIPLGATPKSRPAFRAFGAF